MDTVFGIDKLGFYIPRYVLELKDLALARQIPWGKIHKGLGQKMMSVIPPWEDPITMAVSAAKNILSSEDLEEIDCVIFATESGLDYSKASALSLHDLLGLKETARCIEMKQACYSGTFALQTGLAFLKTQLHHKILVLCSDLARYGFHSKGESSQGAGAVAFVLSARPRIASVNTRAAYLSTHAYDFWRPNGQTEALVDGRYSCQLYLEMLNKVFPQYLEKNPSRELFTACFHTPLPRLVEKAYAQIAYHWDNEHKWTLDAQLAYSRLIGNCYTGSLYLGLISLLENSLYPLDNKNIGMYSYGSGATCDFFDITLMKGYESFLYRLCHQNLLSHRTVLSVEEYESFYQHSQQGGIKGEYGYCALEGIENHKRYYRLKTEQHYLKTDPDHRASIKDNDISHDICKTTESEPVGL